MKKKIIVSYLPKKLTKPTFQEILGELAVIDFLPGTKGKQRIGLLEDADVIVALSFARKEIDPREIAYLKKLAFVQLIFAGADSVPFDLISEDITMASNVGAFAEPIAEHVLALVLALAKNIIPYVNRREGIYYLLKKGKTAKATGKDGDEIYNPEFFEIHPALRQNYKENGIN